MTKFIRVSEVCGNDVTKTVLINTDHIEHIKVGNKGTDTFIKLITPSRTHEAKGSWFFVKESLEQIEAQLSDYSMAPSTTAAMAKRSAAISNMVAGVK